MLVKFGTGIVQCGLATKYAVPACMVRGSLFPHICCFAHDASVACNALWLPAIAHLFVCLFVCRIQQIRTSWQEHPHNNNSVQRLTPECRDLLDKMFDVNQVGCNLVKPSQLSRGRELKSLDRWWYKQVFADLRGLMLCSIADTCHTNV